MDKMWERECHVCNKIIKGGVASLTSFEDMFERHLKTHKLYSHKPSHKNNNLQKTSKLPKTLENSGDTLRGSDERNPAHYCMGDDCDNYLGYRGWCSEKCYNSSYLLPQEDKP